MKSILALLSAVVVMLFSSSTWSALPGYMTAEGETHGNIEGSVTVVGREGKMEIVEFGHAVSAPTERDGYPALGKRQHRPIRITKDIDKSSPILMSVLTRNELLTEVRIDFWRPDLTGQQFQFYTVELTNAFITNITQSIGSTDELSGTPARETLTLTYQKITWTWQDGGIVVEDDHHGAVP